jgi:hypothetical protein
MWHLKSWLKLNQNSGGHSFYKEYIGIYMYVCIIDIFIHWAIIPPIYPRWKAIWFQVPFGRLRLPRSEGSHSSSDSVSKVKLVSAFTPNICQVINNKNRHRHRGHCLVATDPPHQWIYWLKWYTQMMSQ